MITIILSRLDALFLFSIQLMKSLRRGNSMASSEAQKKASIKWQAANMRRVPLDVRKEYYTDILKPAADRVGESVGEYIKKAIEQRMEREQ